MTRSDDVFEQLLRLGVDVHATCEDYGGDSVIDIAIEGTIGEKSFHMVLAHADPVRIPKLHTDGSMRHFVLCNPPKSTEESFEATEPPAATNMSKWQAILKKGVDPNAKASDKGTAVHLAAKTGYLECIKVSVAHHADLTLMDSHGWTAIHYSVAEGHIVVAKYLRQMLQQQEVWERRVAFSVPLSELDDTPLGPLPQEKYSGGTLAHLAVYKQSSEMLQFLQENNLVGDINGRTQEGATLLHFAVCSAPSQSTRWLLDNGADVNAKCGKRGISALHVAFRLGFAENAIALIEKGADFSADSTGITPEMQVNPKICADLLEHFPNIGVPIPANVIEVIRRRQRLESSGNLHKAIVNGDLEACNSIITTTPCFPKIVEECSPCTPLIVALAHDQLEIAKLFLDHGASTNGAPCVMMNYFGLAASALEIAIQKPVFNSLLGKLLEQCLLQEAHWSQRFGYWRPFHLAAAFNPGAIEILANHIFAHSEVFRYVNYNRCTVKDTLNIYQAYMR